MSSLSHDAWTPSALTTRRGGQAMPPVVLARHLRVMIARVLRTGRGPEPLVRWVRLQSADLSSTGGTPVDQLTERLLALFDPPLTRTVLG